MSGRRQRLGRIGEELAARHVEQRGWRVVARNWRCAHDGVRGELDLVAWDGEVLVFCEVKTRRSAPAGEPLSAITPAKQAQLRRLAAAFLACEAVHPPAVRFDALAVSWPATGGGAELVHLEGVC